MANNKHLTLNDRIIIRDALKDRLSFKQIASQLGKDCTTISKEIRKHRSVLDTYAFNCNKNRCVHRFDCSLSNLCSAPKCKSSCTRCRRQNCNSFCPSYAEDVCSHLDKPPYVCNGCPSKSKCALRKMIYDPVNANNDYTALLHESRSGISLCEQEIKNLDTLFSPLIKKGQSIASICFNHKDEINVSQKTIYRLIDNGFFEARNIDLPRQVRYRPRAKKSIEHKVDKKCRINRTLEDFDAFMLQHPDSSVVEMDSVIGVKGGKCILTLHFVQAEFMLGFLRDANDSQSVIDIFSILWSLLGKDLFKKLFQVIKTDNGTEFSNPLAIEFSPEEERRTWIFYCDPGHSEQKGSCEKNHEEFRKIVPKSTSMNDFTQDDINLAFSHVNSYVRKKLNHKTPFDMFSFLYGDDLASKLGITRIPPDDVTLNPSLLKKGGQ